MSRLVSKSNLSRNAVLFIALLFSLSSPIVSYALAENLQAENALATSKVETVLQLDDADRLNIETPIIGSDDSITTDSSEYDKRTPEEQSVSLGNVGDTRSMPLELSEAICSGEWGECSWSINEEGLLRIRPIDGVSGRLADSIGWSPERNYHYFPWIEYAHIINSVIVEEGTVFPADSSGMFYNCYNLTFLDATGWDTSSVMNMSCMFDSCKSLISLKASDWDVSSVHDMSAMFFDCESLNDLDIQDWKTSNVEYMCLMFGGCSSLTILDFYNWDTSSAIDVHRMFENCTSIESLDLSEWKTSRIETMEGMFNGCKSLKTIDVAAWDTSSVITMYSMFDNCTSLFDLNLYGWNTKSIKVSVEESIYGPLFNGRYTISSITVGPHYDMNAGFPEWIGGGKWYSILDDKWYSRSQILNNRSYIADTYYLNKPTLNDATVDDIPNQLYTSIEIKPSPIVKIGIKKLIEGIDYDIKYESNINIGNAKILIIGKGRYSGSLSTSFKILPSKISDAAILPISKQIYTSEGIEPAITIIMNGKNLAEDLDYTITYSNNIEIGTGTVVITGKGNYTGSINATFEIVDSATTEIVYRLYNTKTSEHLWTTSENEYKQLPIITKGDWRQEGIAWNAPDGIGFPVYRLYNKKMGDHYYSMDTNEVRILTSKYGWNVDNNGNPAFWSAAESDEGASPLFCVYNNKLKKGQHHFTRSTVERDFLVANAGWRYEKEAFYGYAEEKTITK